MARVELAASTHDAGKRFKFIHDDGGRHAYMWIRRIPRTVAEDIEERWKGKRKRPKYGGAPYYVQSPYERRMEHYEKAAYALAKIENLEIVLNDDDIARVYNDAAGEQRSRGDVVELNGQLNDGLKFLLFTYQPRSITKVFEYIGGLDQMVEDEEQEATENLSTGSSGESPQNSPQ